MNLKKLTGGLLCLLVFSCSSSNTDTAQTTPIQLYVFDVGEILVNDIAQLGAGVEATAPIRLFNSAFLIRHPKGDLIWDTGFNDSIVNHPLGAPEDAYYSTMSVGLKEQLSALDMKPEDVEYLAVSHQHPDHTGNMGVFTNAKILVQDEAYTALFEATINPDVERVRSNKAERLSGNLDVFGDSSVVIIRTPGHTDGHQVLLVNLPETGPVVLSGDLFLFAHNREKREVPGFNVDERATKASWQAIEDLLKMKKAKLWVQHDYEQMTALPHSPEVIK